MASRFSIEAVFSAIDKMTGPVNRMTGSTTKFSKSVRRDFAKAQRSVERFNRSISSKLATGLKVGLASSIAAVGIGLGIVTRQFIEFDQAIISAGAKFKDLDTSTQAGRKALEDLRKTARQVGADTQFSAVEASKGLDFLAMAGFSSAQAMKLLPGVVDLATIANVDLGRATDIASDALGAFGLATSDTAKLGINFTRLQDVMAKTITSTNTNMETLFETIKFGAPSFTAAGQSMETFNAIAGRMASSGIKGSQAGTALRSAIIRLQAPTKAVKDALDDLGLSQADLINQKTGKLKDMIEIMKLMEKGGKGLTSVQRNAALSAIVGKNATSAWAAVMNEGVIQTERLRDSLLRSSGAAAKMAAEIRKSLMNRLKALGSAATELGFKFIESFDKQGGNAIDRLTKAVREFDPTPIIKGMKTIAKVFITTVGIIGDLMPLIITFTAIWGAYKAALIVAAVKQAILNTAMLTNPVFLVIAGIALLVGGLIILWNKWDDISTIMKVVVAVVMTAMLGAVGLLIFLFILLAKKAGGVGNAFKVIGKVLMKALLIPVNLVIDAIRGFLFIASKIPGIGNTFKNAFDAVSRFRKSINKPFEITEFTTTRAKKASLESANLLSDEEDTIRPGTRQLPSPSTQRGGILGLFHKLKAETNINIRNQSNNEVDSGGKRIGTGSSVTVTASGTP